LDIGAETPEEIALSIVAEIKAVMAGHAGGPLRNSTDVIHSRQASIIQKVNLV
jgi:xanthine/CO dehydrogenase XdhC/CoxF family maturation factor